MADGYEAIYGHLLRNQQVSEDPEPVAVAGTSPDRYVTLQSAAPPGAEAIGEGVLSRVSALQTT